MTSTTERNHFANEDDALAADPTLSPPTSTVPDEDDRRPTPVVWAAVLLVLGSVVSLCARVSPYGRFDGSLLWLLTVPGSLLLAWGLWSLHRWAYWVMAALIVFGLGQNLWRIFVMPEQLGVVYPAVRLVVLGIWAWYWRRPQVRRAFARL